MVTRHRRGKSRPPSRADIASDEYLIAMYEVAYRSLDEVVTHSDGARVVELGSGPGPSRTFGLDWIRTDVRLSDDVELVNRAEDLPYADDSLDAIVMKDVWHHIPDLPAFLDEAHRVLKTGGVVVAFDPYWSLLGRFVYRFLHQEPWNTRAGWTLEGRDPDNSNQAISYILLRRDRALFDARWATRFSVTEHGRHIGPSFLLSGGVSRRTRISGRFLRGLLRWEESRGRWFDNLRFFHTFSLRKT